MIKHNKFIFLHLQKCAGTFVSTFLQNNVKGSTWDHSNTHKGLNVKPKDKFTFGVIRNPWDWYVSWYTKGTHVHGKFSKGKSFPEFMELLYKQKGTLHDINIDQCNKKNIGAYTFRHDKTFKIYPDYICKFESLNDDLIKCFDINKFPLTNKQIEELNLLGKQNTSKHKHYSEYYDDKTIELVRQRDKKIIDKYEYEF